MYLFLMKKEKQDTHQKTNIPKWMFALLLNP